VGWDVGAGGIAGGSGGVQDVEEEVAGFDADHLCKQLLIVVS